VHTAGDKLDGAIRASPLGKTGWRMSVQLPIDCANLNSGRERVATGRAIVRNPQVFLFDEPLSNLDAQLRVQMRTEIKGLHQRLGSTSICVTHDQIEAMTMADKIVVMREGRIEQAGPPLEVYDHPRNLFVAEFLGSPTMNLIAGTLQGNDASRHVVTNGGAMLPLPGNMPGREGQPVYYGIRPDHLAISNKGGLDAIIEVVEPTGADTLVFASIGDQKICGAFAGTPRFPAWGMHRPGAAPRLRAFVRCPIRH
jgi:multiple sugar transport system ATP-binding protein